MTRKAHIRSESLPTTTSSDVLLPLDIPQTESEEPEIFLVAVDGANTRPRHSGIEGSTPIDEFIANLESQPDWAQSLAESRQEIATDIAPLSKLSEMRLSRGLSQKQLAEISGCSQPQLARLERGRGNPSVGTLRRIASALGVQLESVVSAFEATRST